jgi:hypothetical protein
MDHQQIPLRGLLLVIVAGYLRRRPYLKSSSCSFHAFWRDLKSMHLVTRMLRDSLMMAKQVENRYPARSLLGCLNHVREQPEVYLVWTSTFIGENVGLQIQNIQLRSTFNDRHFQRKARQILFTL